MSIDLTNLSGILSRKIRGPALLAILLISIGVSSVSGAEKTGLSVTVSVEELKQLPPQETVILDTRARWKFLLGHIPGAVNVSEWRDFTRKKDGVPGLLIDDKPFIAEKLAALGIEKGKNIVIYGDPSDRWRTDGRFFWMFERFGFKSVAVLNGGLSAWQKAGHDTDFGRGVPPAPGNLKAEDIQLNPDVAADSAWIRSRLKDEKLGLLDTRTRKEFDGATPYGSKRGGHIPGARHLPWELFFQDGDLKDEAQLRAVLKENGIEGKEEVVVYCTGGVRSGMAYFALRSLGIPVRNYDGSWWDWSHNPDLPAEPS